MKDGERQWLDIQTDTFSAYCTHHVKPRGYEVKHFLHDLCDGVVLINLLEVLSHRRLGVYHDQPGLVATVPMRVRGKKGQMVIEARPAEYYDNAKKVLAFLGAENVNLFRMTPCDIVEENHALMLSLVWTIIMQFTLTGPVTGRDDLFVWVRDVVSHSGVRVENFTSDWSSGEYICHLVEGCCPGVIPGYPNLSKDPYTDARTGINLAWEMMQVPPILKPEDMIHKNCDELSIITYLSGFRSAYMEWKKSSQKPLQSVNSRDVGAFVTEMRQFGLTVEVEEGPESKIEFDDEDKGNTRSLTYTPVDPASCTGTYRIHVAWQGVPVEGSPFLVDSEC